MERLTTNKETTELGMYELAHNCCYVKDGLARYRDFETDIDARDFARKLMKSFAGEELSSDNDTFDDEIMEYLMYDATSDARGLVALFYRNLWAMADLREHLKTYEDAEENGLLKHLPCKAGSKVYEIVDDCNFGADCHTRRMCNGCEYRDLHIEPLILVSDYDVMLRMREFGKTIFLTIEEAEQALAKMKGM